MPRVPACLAGEYRRCERHGIADMYGFVPVDRAPGLWGGYADYLYLDPDSMVLPVPPELDPVVSTLFNPLGAGIRWGVNSPGTNQVMLSQCSDLAFVAWRGGRREGGRRRVRHGDGLGARDATG